MFALYVRALVVTAALVCFALAAVLAWVGRPSKAHFVAAGLALWVSLVVWDAWSATDAS